MKARFWIRRTIAAVVLGALTTVLVAWGITLNGIGIGATTSNMTRCVHDAASGMWLVANEERGFGFLSRSAVPYPEPPMGVRATDRLDWMPSGMSASSVWMESRAGWPLHAMMLGLRAPTASQQSANYFPVVTFSFRGNMYAVPLEPAWPAFAADTAIYTVLWVAALAGFAELRRRRRRALGKCPNCLYNLRGLPPGSPCPECGTARAAPQ